MAHKKNDLAVRILSYIDKDGNKRGQYENVGLIMEGDDGDFILLKRTFNPAGVPNPENRDSVLISIFKPDDKKPSPSYQAQQPSPHHNDSDIPF